MEFSFHTEIARITGCADEAAFVHRIFFLVMNNEANERNFHSGKYWTYDSMQALSKVFYFWTPKQLRRIAGNCEKLGLIETGKFAENPLDRRVWYTVTDLVKCIYRDGKMHSPKWANAEPQTGKCSDPNGQMIYKEQLKDLLEDQLEDRDAHAREASKPERMVYGEFGNVRLSGEELEKLCACWDKAQVHSAIESLSDYMASKGKRYKNHYATLRNWLRRDSPQGRRGGGLIEEDWVNE